MMNSLRCTSPPPRGMQKAISTFLKTTMKRLLCQPPQNKPSSCCRPTFMNPGTAAQVVSFQITSRLDSRFGIRLISCSDLIETGRCSYELWENECPHRYCRERHK